MFQYYPREKIYSFEKSRNQEVHIATCERKGGTFIDIRIYQVEEDGSKIQTHKGIFMPVEKLEELKKGIDRAIEVTGGDTEE